MKELSHSVLERLLRSGEFGYLAGLEEAPSKFIEASVEQEVCQSNNADLEIAFRDVLSSELEDGGVGSAEAYEKVKLLIEFSCKVAQQVHSSSADFFGDNSRRIPCMLLEDLLEWQTIAQIDRSWKLVMEPLTEMLTHESVFAKGSTILLRVCNGVLRRLSRSVDTELRGRILMFLAYIFPISERSAVNLYGKNNTTNITHFDTKEVFLGDSNQAADESGNKNNGSKNDGGEPELGEEYMDLEEIAPGADDSKGTSGAAEGDPYTEYKNFWALQNLLSADMKTIKPADLRSSMNKVLSTLEKRTHTQYKPEEQAREDALAAIKCAAGEKFSSSSSSSSSTANIGQKYLTDSQLFLLELADSQFRQQVCIQILMACQHLRFVEEESSQAATAASAAVVDGKSKGGQGGGKGKAKGKDEEKEKEKERAKAEAEKAFAKLMLLKGIESRAFAALANSHGGPRLCEALKQMLHRESFWKGWKQTACPPLEDRKRKDVPVPGSSSSSSDGARGALGQGKQDFEKKWLLKAEDLAKSDLLWSRSLDDVNTRAKGLSSDIPSYAGHIEAYKEADDPEAGIEAEYHPKHDALYCWRARRLLAAGHVSAFGGMHDGDLAKGIAFADNEGEGAAGQPIQLKPLVTRKAPTYPSAEQLAAQTKSEKKGAEGTKGGKEKQKEEDESKMEVEEEKSEIGKDEDDEKEKEGEPEGEKEPAPEEEEEGEGDEEGKKPAGKGKGKGRGRANSKTKTAADSPAEKEKEKEKEDAPTEKGKKRKRR